MLSRWFKSGFGINGQETLGTGCNSDSHILNQLDTEAESPQRTPLYADTPVGVGTPLLEAQTSYIGRLADAHQWSVGDLAGRFLSAIPNPYGKLVQEQVHRKNGFFTCRYDLNGISERVQAWVHALSVATGIQNLQNLTFLPFKGAIGDALFKTHRTWCPYCFEEWKSSRHIIYEPLIWAVNVCSVCPLHGCSFRDTCPGCKRKRPPLASHFTPGYCDHCNTWLGVPVDDSIGSGGSASCPEGQMQISRKIGELLELMPRTEPDVARRSLRENISAYISALAGKNESTFVRHIGCSVGLASCWVNGSSVPRLDTLVRASQMLDVPLVSFYAPGGPSDSDLESARNAVARTNNRSVIPHRRTGTIQGILLDALEEQPPPSLKDLAARLGYKRPDPFYRTDLVLSHRVTVRHRRFLKSETKREGETVCGFGDLKRALERSLSLDTPHSVIQVARMCGYKTTSVFYKNFPGLCKRIRKKMDASHKAYMAHIHRSLRAALKESPAPSLADLGNRLGCSEWVLRKHVPRLCARIGRHYSLSATEKRAELGRRAAAVLMEDVAPSVVAVAKRLGVSTQFLRVHFPMLVATIAKRHRAYVAAAREKRRSLLYNEVLSIVADLHKKHTYVSVRHVFAELRGGFSRDCVEIRMAVNSAKASLGIA